MTSRSSKSNGNSTASLQNKNSLNAMLIGDFKIGAKLGQGTFSKVCQGVHLPTGEKVAIKILSKDQIKEKKITSSKHSSTIRNNRNRYNNLYNK